MAWLRIETAMKLKISANSARERIHEMIISGTILLEKVMGEYTAAKDSDTFSEKDHVPEWRDQYVDWFHKCLAVLQEIFPTPIEAIQVKDARGSLSYQSGVNVKVNAIINDIRVKLSALEKIINSVNNYSMEMTDELFIEDIDSFAKARDVNPRQVKRLVPLKLSEDQIRAFFEEIIGATVRRQESDEHTTGVFTAQVKLGGERLSAAFLLKGKGTKGKLTIKKCEKDGGQIVRLVEVPADLYVIQHVDGVDERVIRDLKEKIESINTQGKSCRMCVIDGTDTARILLAYGKIQH